MARKSKVSVEKRTTFPFVTNLVTNDGGRLIYRTDQRSYGEGPIVALKNGLKKELANNQNSEVDKSTLSPFGGVIMLNGGEQLFCSVVFDSSQCPVCGATRDNPHAWCDACNGKAEVDLEAEAQKLLADL